MESEADHSHHGPVTAARRGWLRRLKARASGVIITLGKIRPLATFGYMIYGACSRSKRAWRGNVPNMGVLSRRLWRGGQPREAGFAWLKAQGVDTILNLRREARWVEKACSRHGLRYHFLPMPVFDAPNMDLVYRFLEIVTDPTNGTIFFHCYHGSDRTGTMAAIYRIAVQEWSLEQAVAELDEHGFHPGYYDRSLDFLARFAEHWTAMPYPVRARILHAGHC